MAGVCGTFLYMLPINCGKATPSPLYGSFAGIALAATIVAYALLIKCRHGGRWWNFLDFTSTFSSGIASKFTVFGRRNEFFSLSPVFFDLKEGFYGKKWMWTDSFYDLHPLSKSILDVKHHTEAKYLQFFMGFRSFLRDLKKKVDAD